MGQTLSEPATDKRSQFGEDERLVFGVSEMQGWRISMEDAHANVLVLQQPEVGPDKCAFFAVYDGHGGSTVARFSGETVHKRLVDNDAWRRGDYEAALKHAYLQTDEALRANPEFDNDPSGCTAVSALLVGPSSVEGSDGKKAQWPRRIYVANAGDSRSVLSVKGQAKAMSFDHKPGNKDENERIVSAGGFVEFGRVNGNLALSRAIGDFEFKRHEGLNPEEQIVTANPEVITHDVEGEEEFLILACDGIWDCLNNQQVVDFVRRQIAQRKELQTICEELMDRCLAPESEMGGVGCDNMTASVVAILNGRTKEEWYDWVADRVEKKIGWDTPEDIPPVFTSHNNAGGAGRPGLGAGSVLRALGGSGLGDDDDGPLGGPGLMLPGGLASALSSAGFVFRPGGRLGENDEGDIVYKTHVVNEDDSSDEHVGEGGQLVELEDVEEGEGSGSARRQADGEGQTIDHTSRPDIVQSPESTETKHDMSEDYAAELQRDVDEEKNGSVAEVEAKTETPSDAVKAEGLMDASEDPTRT